MNSSSIEFVLNVLLSPWVWGVLGLICFGFVLVFFYRKCKRWALEKLRYSRSFSTDGIFVGETIELVETVSNPTWFPLFALNIEFFMPSGLTVDGVKCNKYTKLASIFNVPPFSTVTKTHIVNADRRDHYKLFTAHTKYRAFEYTYDSSIDFYAYPNQYDADVNFSPDIFRAGEAIADRKYIEDPFFFSGLRAYRPGDSMRSINYKASVRAFSGGVRRLMCNEYDSSRNYDSMIFLDLTAYPEVEIDNIDQVEIGLRYACYLFALGVNNGGGVGFCANCATGTSRYIHIPCGNSELHTKLVLEQFAEISPYARRDYSMERILQNHAPQLSRGTDIYWITPFVDDKTAEILSALQRAGRNVQVIPLLMGEQK